MRGKVLKKFQHAKGGNVAISMAIFALPLLAAGGASFDYAYLSRLDTKLQAAADTSALAAARELGLANSDKDNIQALASNYALSHLQDIATPSNTTVTTDSTEDNSSLSVSISHVWKPFFLHYVMEDALPIKVSATATLAGTGTICMLGLDEKLKEAIHLTKNASLNASGCGVYSNSSDKEAIKVEDNATLVSGVTCSAGGIKSSKKSSFTPDPVTDCPQVPDPLAGRLVPVVGSCDYTNFEIDTGIHVLYPGTYCEGLKIKGTAEASLKPGIYIVSGDKLEVTEKASLKGENVGFFLNGHKAKLKFAKESTINLTAPKTGVMAGLLMFEDPAAFNDLQKHEITSDNARMLLGTIYLPNGTLRIDSKGPVADQAAYTAIIARAIELDEGPTLYLNSDYEATDVPVPEGLVNDRVYLSE